MKKSDLKTGMIVETRNGDRYLVMRDPNVKKRDLIRFGGGVKPLKDYDESLRHSKDAAFTIDKIYSAGKTIEYLFYNINKMDLKLIWKRPDPILDEVERKYLRTVINPLKSRVDYIYKLTSDEDSEHIRIVFKDFPYVMAFPSFKKGSMYKGMSLDKGYTLEELGL